MIAKTKYTAIGIYTATAITLIFIIISGIVPQFYEHFIESNTTDKTTALINKGQNSLNLGQWDLAISYYKQALELEPQNGDALTGLGQVYMNQRNESKALKLFYQAATESDMLFPDMAYGFAGTIYEQQNKNQRAILAYRKAAEVAYEPVKAYVNMAGLFLKIGIPDSAIYYADQAMVAELNLNNWYMATLRASMKFYEDDDEIVSDIQKKMNEPYDSLTIERFDKESLMEARKFTLNAAGANHFMGVALAQKGMLEPALEHLRIANLIAPQNQMISSDLQAVMQMTQNSQTIR